MDALDSVLSAVVGDGRLLTVQPGGNPGDTLIYRGFDEYLEGADVDRTRLVNVGVKFDDGEGFPGTDLLTNAQWAYEQWQYARSRLFDDVDAVYVHGGGNFNDIWEVGMSCYRNAARYFDCPIVVGPQSCWFDGTDPSALFQGVDNETHFFCRERYSRDIVADATADCPHVEVHMEEDTALFLDAGDLPVRDTGEEYTLVAMRMDKDSADPTIEDDVPGPVKVNDISATADSFEEWVNAAARAQYIYTDRLHIAILGSILDKPMTWYDTGFHKSRGVYQYSLAGEPGIEFHSPELEREREG